MLSPAEEGRRRRLVDAIDALPFTQRAQWLARLHADVAGTQRAFFAAGLLRYDIQTEEDTCS